MQIHPYKSNAEMLIVFFYGALFNIFAGLDYKSLLDYGVKAILGGVVWLIFKLLADRMGRKKTTREKEREDKEQEEDISL